MRELITKYQHLMRINNIGVSIIPTADYHMSEYIPNHFKTREYLSGFTGSAGTLLISVDLEESIDNRGLKSILDEALLWTDGRYYLQAAEELAGSEIFLMRQQEKNIPSVFEHTARRVSKVRPIGLNFKLFSIDFINQLKKKISEKYPLDDIKFVNFDPSDQLWPNRPAIPKEIIYVLEDYFAGETYQCKKAKVVEMLEQQDCDVLLLSSLEDQAWLYNLRGNDISYTPVFLSYTLLTKDKTILYVDKSRFGFKVAEYLRENDIIVKPYDDIYSDLEGLKNHNILLNQYKVNYELYRRIKLEKNKVKFSIDPTTLLKAIKNQTEINNTKSAHLKDGIAVTKFIYNIKKIIKDKANLLTEYDASLMLDKIRASQTGFIEPSFETICGYQANAAKMHYKATKDNSIILANKGILLFDSGGHYLEGSTDITRTIALGQVSDEVKKHYTYVLKSLINLSKAVFIEGTTGSNLDILARGPIWSIGLDYRCGTGHGVGHILGVHEGPNNFRYNLASNLLADNKIKPGMITTNEPGIYLDGKYGIRIENEMLCYKSLESEYGEYYAFETITYVPFDLDLIDESLLTKEEKNFINQYHTLVKNKLKDYLEPDCLAWLEFATKGL